MGTSNGSVSGLVKVHDSGASSDRFNLVFVAEGYQVTELAQFESDVQQLVDHLFNTAPFDEDAVACAINIYRLDVISDESGADFPACEDGMGDDSTSATYFDATFCFDGQITRLMAGDSDLVQSTVEAVLPEWTQIIVIVNDSRRGGAGGSIAWLTTGGFDWRDVMIHEMGHAAFGLADEYDYYAGGDEEGQDNHPGPEPMQPNVTNEPDPTLVKWSSLVTASGNVPTMNNADCSTVNNAPSPVAAGIVGTFEGAHYYHCDAYRPEYDCMMRNTGAPFCAVCQKEVRDTMAEYAVPATTGAITQDTFSLAFDDIPEGTSTVRPIVFSVDTCLPVTFQVIAAPSAPFSVAFEPIVISNPGPGTVRLARVWMRYDCGNAGDSHNDSVTIRAVETGTDYVVPLSGNCVPRETAAVQLVFDQSGSMLDPTSEGRLKKDVLKDSARVMADVAYDDTGLGANTYDENAHPLLDFIDAGPLSTGAGRQALRNAIDAYEPTPGGLTATGDGIEFAKTKLDAATSYDNHAMIVLTDGKDTASKSVDEVADGVINQTVFAIGLGTAQQINPQTLESLAGTTGGYMLMTGLLTQDDTFLLEKFYLQILAGVTNNDIILDPEGYLSPTAPIVRIPFHVADTDIEISAVTLATLTGPIDMALEVPSGKVYTQVDASVDPSLEYAKSNDSIVMRASLPLVDDGNPQREGLWHLLVRLDSKKLAKFIRALQQQYGDNAQSSAAYQTLLALLSSIRQHGVKYSAIVQTYSNLNMKATLQQSGYEPGAVFSIETILTEYGGPFRGSATVFADVILPNDALTTMQLNHKGDGVYSNSMTSTLEGLYSMRIRAKGTTNRGRSFTREQIRTASVWLGGDQPTTPPQSGDPNGTPDDGLIDILCCLFEHDGFNGKFDEWLKESGINPDAFRRCIREICKDRQSNRPKSLTSVNFNAAQLAVIREQVSRFMAAFPPDNT